jgi:MFS family permease
MMRNRGMSLSSAGLAAGVTMGISQACGALLAGMLSDRLARGGRHRGGHIAAAALLASVPLGLGFILAPGRTTAISCLVLFGVFGAAWTSPGYNAILGTVEPRMRGRAMALIQLLTTMCGAALAPFVIGVLSDAVGGSQSLVTALALLFPVGLWSALHFRLASRAIARSSAA